jgi:hypothetical protein
MVSTQNSKNTKNGKTSISSRDIAIAIAACAAILIATVVIFHVTRASQPHIIYRPIANASPKAAWMRAQHQQLAQQGATAGQSGNQ